MVWDFVKIGDVCKTGAGGTPLKSRKEYYEGGTIPWLLSGEVAQGEIHKSETFITQTGLDNSSAKIFPVNTVLVAMYGATAGQVGILRCEAATNQAVCGILPNSNFVPEFLFYAMLSKQAELISTATGNAQPNISQIKVKNTIIPLPPLPEQKRIVAILDEAFAGIDAAVANTEKNLANARELFESYLNAVFTQKGDGWVEKPVGEIADHCLGKMLDKRKNKGELKPYLRNLNVRWFDFDLTDLLEMKFEAGEVDRYSVRKGDVVICEGGYPGRAAIWPHDETIYFQKALHRVRFKEPLHNRWLLYFLFLSDSNGYLKQFFTGAGIQHFTGKALKRFVLPIAPTSEIERHLDRFEELHAETQRLEAIYQQKLSALAELKQSILQKAFAGELTALPEKEIEEAVA